MSAPRPLLPIALLGLLFAACSAAGGERRPDAAAREASAAVPDVELAGWRIIGCCCPTPCPCRLNKKPTHCHGCDHTDAVLIERGHIGPTRMDGVAWVVVGRGFGRDTKQNWAHVYVGDRATDEQMKAVQGMLESDVKAWGPKAPHLAGNFLGLKKAAVRTSVSADEREYGVEIPGILEFRTRSIVNPGRTEPVVSTGILDAFGDRFVHADCLVHRLDDPAIGYAWDLTGRQSNQARFRLDGARLARGGIGWGCWTAHADFGDDEKYGEELVGHPGGH